MATGTIPSQFRQASVTLYAPSTPTDVSSSTTITLSCDRTLFTRIQFFFTAAAGTGSTVDRSIIEISSLAVGSSAWYALGRSSSVGSVKIAPVANEPTKITIAGTSFSALYLYRVIGLN